MDTTGYKYSLFFISALAISNLLWQTFAVKPAAIEVYAGQDSVICTNESLLLSSLNATIKGDVTDGIWISWGHGKFQPGNLSVVRYSDAQSQPIIYEPGAEDKVRGYFNLVLISDAPNGNTNEKVTDEVRITIQNPPPLFCTSNINISLNENCVQVVDASMLQNNPTPPLSKYIVTLYGPDGKLIPNNTLTRDHLDKEITYRLGHRCTQNICWGKFKVEDYFPPLFRCKNDTISCTRSILPDSVGLPIPPDAYIVSFEKNKYTIANWDKCSDVSLEYNDEIIKANCARDEDRTIIRKWKATDKKGNASSCEQIIVVKRLPLNLVSIPPHFDGHERPALECGQNFPVLPNGHPSPDTTGRPGIGFCGHLQFQMTDIRFDLCGKTFKIARSWYVIDWCTSESITKNQIIMIADTKPPMIACQDIMRLQTSVYTCSSVQTPIPTLSKVEDCNTFSLDWTLKSTSGSLINQHIVKQGDKAFLTPLPVGQYLLTYIVSDVCGNISTCQTAVVVEDHIAPSVACDQTTKVSLGLDGTSKVFANTFDDGSIDNCGIATFKVRKMANTCNSAIAFGDYVEFCCQEIGSKIMVALQVTDIHGNSNTCMVEVIVEDKLKPSITCPPDLTLECSESVNFNNLDIYGKVASSASDIKDIIIFNHYHHGVIGKDGRATDNCNVTITQKYTFDIKCDTGTIVRTFIATDLSGLSDSCKQIITIKNPNPFNGDDPKQLIWPVNFISEGCRSSDIHPNITGKPSFTNDGCAAVAASYEDLTFYLADSACVKIIRTWTVLDWCQFSTENNKGKWGPYVQIIKLHNSDKPEFTSICKDTIICSYDNNCNNGWVNVYQSAIDSCTANTDLVWRYEIDIHNNGSTDTIGSTNDFAGFLPIGTHKITWRVEDQCGNYNTCSHKITVRDCKNPVPYCISELTTSLMQGSKAVEIWAKDFDKGSSDNCTNKDSLIFTFGGALPVDSMKYTPHYFLGNGILSDSTAYRAGTAQRWLPQTKSSGLYFDCQNIPDGRSSTISLAMTVTDSNKNQDSCVIVLHLQDNADVCPDNFKVYNITGSIFTVDNQVPRHIEVNYETSEAQGVTKVDNQTGSFQFSDLPSGKEYTIKPYLNSSAIEGVSTFDLIKIQRHILDLEPFDSPYKFIAADINSSGSVTASDLVELRKLILGIYNEFPKGLTSWIFVDKQHGLTDPRYPFDYKKSIETGILSGDKLNVDFTAVKIGDINLSALDLKDQTTENRSQNIYPIKWEVITDHGVSYVNFIAGENTEIEGIQMFLDIKNADLFFGHNPVILKSIFKNQQIYANDQSLRWVGYDVEHQRIDKNTIILSIKVENTLDDALHMLTESERSSEMYSHGAVKKISIAPSIGTGNPPLHFSLVANPVYDALLLQSNKNTYGQKIDFTIMDMQGKIFDQGSASHHTETRINLHENTPPGVYVLKIRFDKDEYSLKYIKIK